MFTAVSVLGWLMFLVAFMAAVRYKGDAQDLERALDATSKKCESLEQMNQDWANRNGQQAHRTCVLGKALLDVVAIARKAIDDQGSVK